MEDSWNLPDDVSITKAKIVVIGEAPKKGEENVPSPQRNTLPTPKRATLPTPKRESLSPEDQAKLKIRECYDVGDYSGCLELAETFLKRIPEEAEVTNIVEKCRKVLMQMYESRIGDFDRIPRRAVTEEELVWRNLDPLTGFIAATVDGMLTFENIIDISTVPRFETCRILSQLLQDGIIE